jgi:hypothetical protein
MNCVTNERGAVKLGKGNSSLKILIRDKMEGIIFVLGTKCWTNKRSAVIILAKYAWNVFRGILLYKP